MFKCISKRFFPVRPENAIQHQQRIYDLNFTNLLFYYAPQSGNKPILEYLQSYSDGCRYNLNITKGYIPFIANGQVHPGHFCFIEMRLMFDLPFNFICFRNDYANYWGRDTDIATIKPLIYTAGSEHRTVAIAAFRSLASSFFRRITDRIVCNQLIHVFLLQYDLNQVQKHLHYFCSQISFSFSRKLCLNNALTALSKKQND